MPSTKELRARIRSVSNTAKVTGAMQLIAASKMRRAQQNVIMGKKYAETIKSLLTNLSSSVDLERVNIPLLEKREIKKRVIANRKKHAMKYANKKPSLNDHKKMIRDSLDIDPGARSICGERLGGIIKSDRIVGIECPQCHRKTVYFYPATVISYNAESKRWIGAVGPVRCSHRNNCGYVDSLKNLWRDRGSP